MRILVVGAGPTGLTAALELARRGHDVTLIERRSGPSPLSRAVGILESSMEIFAASGVADPIRAEAVDFAGVILHDGARPVGRLPLGFDDRSHLFGLAQNRTEHHLAEALARHGVQPRFSTPLEGFKRDDTGVRARFGGTEERFDWLVGADGVGSLTRRTLGLDFTGYDLPTRWSIADIESSDLPDPDWFRGFLLPNGRVCVVAPLSPTRFRVIASTPDALAALPVPIRVDHLHRADDFTISVRQVAQYRIGRVCLAGDAAHCHSPVGGRGMNLGISDAADLAQRLTGGDIDGYTAARHAEGRKIIRLSEALRRRVQSENPVARAALKGLFHVIAAIPPLGRGAAHRLTGN